VQTGKRDVKEIMERCKTNAPKNKIFQDIHTEQVVYPVG